MNFFIVIPSLRKTSRKLMVPKPFANSRFRANNLKLPFKMTVWKPLSFSIQNSVVFPLAGLP